MFPMSDQGIDRRAVLGMLAAAPVVAKLDVDELTDDEAAMLELCARSYGTDNETRDPKTGRYVWNYKDYPSFDRDSDVVKLGESLEKRGLVNLHFAHAVLPDGTEIGSHFYITDRGRKALAAHIAKHEPTSPSWSFPEGDVCWTVTDWYVDPTNTQIVPPEPRS